MARLGDLFGKAFWAPVKAILPKNPWLRIAIIAIPILLVMALLEPVFGLLEKGVDLLVRLIAPLMETSGGRLLLLNLILLFLMVVAFLLLRSRLRKLFSGLTLRRHLQTEREQNQTTKKSDEFNATTRRTTIVAAPNLSRNTTLSSLVLGLDNCPSDR